MIYLSSLPACMPPILVFCICPAAVRMFPIHRTMHGHVQQTQALEKECHAIKLARHRFEKGLLHAHCSCRYRMKGLLWNYDTYPLFMKKSKVQLKSHNKLIEK